jgi:hypothetical protein
VEGEVFLPVPPGYSGVPGLSFEWQYIGKNIVEGKPGAALLVDEQLWLTIRHDGSNPFCSSNKCQWRMLFLAPTTEVPLELHSRGDTLTKLICLPYRGSIARIDIVDGVFENRPGIWVVLDIEDESAEDGEEYDIAFPLVEYARSG